MDFQSHSDKGSVSAVMEKKVVSRPLILKRKRPKSWWERRWRYLYIRFIRLREHPKAIARGLAVGVFAGSFPLFGFQMLIGVFLAIILRGSKVAAAAGTWISNPLTYVPLFAFNYKIGKWLLRWDSQDIDPNAFQQNWESWSNLVDSGLDLLLVLFFGSFCVGIVLSVFTYIFSLKFLYRQRRRV